MAIIYKAPRGTYDVLPSEGRKWSFLESTARSFCKLYGYNEVRTPVFEQTELFRRGVGEVTDIVEKEMYTFQDLGGRSLTLRPEGTAPVVRAYVENKVFSQEVFTKWFYIGPMFRYERPQSGRYRQLSQFGIEAFGADTPEIDVEVISLAVKMLERVGLSDLKVYLNNIGTRECRAKYKEALVAYLEDYTGDLDDLERDRLHRNPLRILDSKIPKTKLIVAGAPSILDFLDKESRGHFERVQELLLQLDVPYEVNSRLVRGLDYYNSTAFEFVIGDETSPMAVVGGGGRYNGLVKDLGGPDVSGIGFGMGLDRVILNMDKQSVVVSDNSGVDCYVVSLGDESKNCGVEILQDLRLAGISAESDYLGRKFKAQLKAAVAFRARYAIILGDEEIKQGRAAVKDLADGTQEMVAFGQLLDYVKRGVVINEI